MKKFPLNKEMKKHIFWLVVMILILAALIPLINNRQRCLEYKKETKKVTYYDFSESGTGVTEGEETSYHCLKWEVKK